MREMRDSGVAWIGEVPAGWEVAPLKHFLIRNDSGAWGEEPKGDEGEICLRVADFDYEKLRFKEVDSDRLTRRVYAAQTIKKLAVEPGDILIEKSGGSAEYPVGRSVLFTRDYKALFSNFMQRIRVNPNVLDANYTCYMLAALYQSGVTRFHLTQATGIQNIHLKELFSAPYFLFPPLPEQRRIAGWLDERCADIDAAVEAARASIDEYEAYKKSVIACAVTRGLDPDAPLKDTGIPWLGQIPAGWEVRRLGLISQRVFDGPFGSHLKTVDYVDSGIRVVRLENLRYLKFNDEKRSYVSESKYEEIRNHTVYPDDLIMATFVEDEVRVCELPANCSFAVNKSDCVGIRLDEGESERRFVQYSLSSIQTWDYLCSLLHGATRSRVNVQQIKSIPVPLPPLPEQRQIAAYLDSRAAAIDAVVAQKRAIVEDLLAYKKSLIYEAVTGKREV